MAVPSPLLPLKSARCGTLMAPVLQLGTGTLLPSRSEPNRQLITKLEIPRSDQTLTSLVARPLVEKTSAVRGPLIEKLQRICPTTIRRAVIITTPASQINYLKNCLDWLVLVACGRQSHCQAGFGSFLLLPLFRFL